MADLATASLHHIALTVTSLERSVPWYEQVFGISFQMDAPHEGGTAKLLADQEWKLVIVLHQHEANEREPFSPSRTGLDHIGFMVPTRADLERWQAHLETHGVRRSDVAATALTQSPIADTPY